MGKKIVFIKDLPKDVNFDKFLPDAVEKPLFKMVFWSRKEDEARQQLAIDTQRNQLYELQHINTSKTRSWLLDNDVHKGK
jgi:hypothetical protein